LFKQSLRGNENKYSAKTINAYTSGTHKTKVRHPKMETKHIFRRMNKLIIDDEKLAATLVSYLAIFLIFINLTIVHSSIIGFAASLTFFLIDTVFIGQVFFRKEKPFLRLMLGSLLLIALLCLVSWATMIIYNLDEIRSTIALFIVATVSSLINKLETNRLNR
jgi:uncharacterized membrane protein (UPF0182 family)